jgi:hypothetical protein
LDFFIIFIGIPLLILVITGPVAAIVFVALVKRNQLRWLPLYSLALVASAAVVGVFIAQKFGGLFPGIGCFTALLTPVVAIFTFAVFRKRAKQLKSSTGLSSLQSRWLLIGLVLLPVLQLFTPAVSYTYGLTCESFNINAAPPIISAMHAYQTDTGSYPSDLNTLVPHYLASIPPSACAMPFFNLINTGQPGDAVWNVVYCSFSPKQETYLTIPVIGSDLLQTYNLKTQRWSFGSSFEGFC